MSEVETAPDDILSDEPVVGVEGLPADEAPHVENPADVPPAEEEIKDRVFELNFNGVNLPVRETKKKKTKKGKGLFSYFIELSLSLVDPFADVKRAVGVENFNREVAKIVQSAAKDAQHEAESSETDQEGKFYPDKFVECFCNWFKPESRTGKNSLRELKAKLAELNEELAPFAVMSFRGEVSDEETKMKIMNLAVRYEEIQAKIEEKSRKGSKKPLVATPVAPVTA